MANKAVLKFLEDHIRPFSANEIQQGVAGDFGKSAIQKALDFLVSEEKVKEKTYGKQKVYCIMQQNSTSEIEHREKLLELDREIKDKELQLNEVSDKLKKTLVELNSAKGKMTLEQALTQKIQLEGELERIKQELERFSGVEMVCPKVKNDADKDLEKVMGEYKKRKRICLDVLNSILENYPKTKKVLFEDIGIETDEDAEFYVDKL